MEIPKGQIDLLKIIISALQSALNKIFTLNPSLQDLNNVLLNSLHQFFCIFLDISLEFGFFNKEHFDDVLLRMKETLDSSENRRQESIEIIQVDKNIH